MAGRVIGGVKVDGKKRSPRRTQTFSALKPSSTTTLCGPAANEGSAGVSNASGEIGMANFLVKLGIKGCSPANSRVVSMTSRGKGGILKMGKKEVIRFTEENNKKWNRPVEPRIGGN